MPLNTCSRTDLLLYIISTQNYAQLVFIFPNFPKFLNPLIRQTTNKGIKPSFSQEDYGYGSDMKICKNRKISNTQFLPL